MLSVDEDFALMREATTRVVGCHLDGDEPEIVPFSVRDTCKAMDIKDEALMYCVLGQVEAFVTLTDIVLTEEQAQVLSATYGALFLIGCKYGELRRET